jgi:hypothetical protein
VRLWNLPAYYVYCCSCPVTPQRLLALEAELGSKAAGGALQAAEGGGASAFAVQGSVAKCDSFQKVPTPPALIILLLYVSGRRKRKGSTSDTAGRCGGRRRARERR